MAPRWLVTLAGVALSGSTAASAGPIRMALEPADRQASEIYRDVVISVENRSTATVRGVSVRMADGGPTLLFPLTAPPEANAALPAALPVCAPQQGYRLRALAGDDAGSAPLAEVDVSTTWAPNQISPVSFIDPAPYDEAAAYSAAAKGAALGWPSRTRRNVLILALAACVALAGALFIRRPALRVVAVAVVTAGAVVGAALVLSGPVVDARYVYREVSSGMGTNALVPTHLVLTCCRTTEWRHPSADLLPVYSNAQQMAEDNAVIHSERGLSLRIAPGQTRIFLAPQPRSRPATTTQVSN